MFPRLVHLVPRSLHREPRVFVILLRRRPPPILLPQVPPRGVVPRRLLRRRKRLRLPRRRLHRLANPRPRRVPSRRVACGRNPLVDDETLFRETPDRRAPLENVPEMASPVRARRPQPLVLEVQPKVHARDRRRAADARVGRVARLLGLAPAPGFFLSLSDFDGDVFDGGVDDGRRGRPGRDEVCGAASRDAARLPLERLRRPRELQRRGLVLEVRPSEGRGDAEEAVVDAPAPALAAARDRADLRAGQGAVGGGGRRARTRGAPRGGPPSGWRASSARSPRATPGRARAVSQNAQNAREGSDASGEGEARGGATTRASTSEEEEGSETAPRRRWVRGRAAPRANPEGRGEGRGAGAGRGGGAVGGREGAERRAGARARARIGRPERARRGGARRECGRRRFPSSREWMDSGRDPPACAVSPASPT